MNLYSLARGARTLSALLSGDPARMTHRARNVVIGRTMARGGVWQALWGRKR